MEEVGPEEERKGKKECIYEGRRYSHGKDTCVIHNLLRCNDGNWEYEFWEHRREC